ncbi:unnamed protein product [Colias eurytheme]|nr:unnamed protein product [Colias eurytheme]
MKISRAREIGCIRGVQRLLSTSVLGTPAGRADGMSRRRRRVAFRDYMPMDLKAMAKEYEEEGRRSRRHSSPCNSREGSTTALHTQHYDDTVSSPS